MRIRIRIQQLKLMRIRIRIRIGNPAIFGGSIQFQIRIRIRNPAIFGGSIQFQIRKRIHNTTENAHRWESRRPGSRRCPPWDGGRWGSPGPGPWCWRGAAGYADPSPPRQPATQVDNVFKQSCWSAMFIPYRILINTHPGFWISDPGSRIQEISDPDLSIPDPGFQIPYLGYKNYNKRGGGRKFFGPFL